MSKNAEALAVERESGGTTAELAKLEEQGIEVSTARRGLYSKEPNEVGSEGGEK